MHSPSASLRSKVGRFEEGGLKHGTANQESLQSAEAQAYKIMDAYAKTNMTYFERSFLSLLTHAVKSPSAEEHS